MVVAGHPEKINFPTVDRSLLACLVVVFNLNFTCGIYLFYIHYSFYMYIVYSIFADSRKPSSFLVVHVCASLHLLFCKYSLYLKVLESLTTNFESGGFQVFGKPEH